MPLDPSSLLAVAKPNNRVSQIGQLYGSAAGLLVTNTARAHEGLTLLVTANTTASLKLEREIQFYSAKQLPCQVFPDWETLPYDWFSPHEDIISHRLETLLGLNQQTTGVLIVSVATLMHRLAPKNYILGSSLNVKVGDELAIDTFRKQLDEAGYQYVSEVNEHGEYTVRGSLIDLYPMGSSVPYRLDLFDNDIESIRSFNPETQRTLEKHQHIRLLPAREFPMDEKSILGFRQRHREQLEGDPNKSVIYRDISQGLIPAGSEYYLPLFFDQTDTLFDYLPESCLLVCLGDCANAADDFYRQVENRYEQRRHDSSRPILKPDTLFVSPEQLGDAFNALPKLSLQNFELEQIQPPEIDNAGTKAPPNLLIVHKAQDPLLSLKSFIADYDGRICFVAESTGRREFILDLFRPHGIKPTLFDDWHAFITADDKLGMLVSPLEQGLSLIAPELCVITEPQLFGERAHQRKKRQRSVTDQEAVIQSLTDLQLGSPVVHFEHGVGRYRGLVTLDINAHATEFLLLEYANEDKLYVPVSSLHLISRYTGASPENAPLHRLGSDHWSKAKRKASERANDIAVKLLDIYSRRAAQSGHAYAFNESDYQQFRHQFPFEETPDQEKAIDDVINDMCSERPMDRVICGDVGFGKTEVAMRATFVAIEEGMQVAVLVPTTLLAQQHYQNFQDRFSDWPVKIEVLSRFKSKKETDAVLAGLASGKIDIIIGTHKLIQKNIKFKNLGLLILDEEHRFGVQQKEQLKALRAKVDVLTMTATPIPRTLNMALSGIRDLSIIATPPVERVAIKTFVNQWNDILIQEAILREIKRGGQVFFLHNKVQSIEKMADDIRKLVPEAEVRIAHGQMRERQLEQVMLDFYHQRFNVLVCTTIIESGIDIPTANTIIINRADLFGLAQLHQMRGRVGRSHHRAYAYMITPPKGAMTADAQKRLEAIESLEDLGSGFMLATHDLEIRGAGELLGEEQSGQISEIGFSLYMELLERAIKSLKSGESVDLNSPLDTGPEIELNIPALIDESYLPDIHARLILYKRIANAKSNEVLRDLKVEMIDRFGLLTDSIKNLFEVTEVKLKAQSLGIIKVTANDKGARVQFGDSPNINHAKLITLIQTQTQRYQFDGQDKFRIIDDLAEPEKRIKIIHEALDSIKPD